MRLTKEAKNLRDLTYAHNYLYSVAERLNDETLYYLSLRITEELDKYKDTIAITHNA